MSPALVFVVGAALAASLARTLLDFLAGLYGSGGSMTVAEGLLLFAVAGLYGWWPVAFLTTDRGERGGATALLVLCSLWVAFYNGFTGLAVCPPPCAISFPYRDIAHVASLVSGTVASVAIWRAYPGKLTLRATWPVTAILLLIAVLMLSALTLV